MLQPAGKRILPIPAGFLFTCLHSSLFSFFVLFYSFLCPVIHFLRFSKNIINISKNDKNILIFNFYHAILPVTAIIRLSS